MREHLIEALTEALQDEYKAHATYQAILDRFGPVRPFVNILESEKRHIQALLSLFTRYQIAVPEDNWPVLIAVPTDLQQACEEGVQGEIENGAMYERLLVMTVEYPDVQRVFRQLQWASQENHLPAFQRCAARSQGAFGAGDRGDRPVSPLAKTGILNCEQSDVAASCSTESTTCHQGRQQQHRRRRGRNGLRS
jgi:hypothetical protein